MIHTESWDENKSNFIKIKIKKQEFEIVNVADWGDEKEIIYIYPIEFPDILDIVLETINIDKLEPNLDLNKVYSKSYIFEEKIYIRPIEVISTLKNNLYEIIKSLLYYNFNSEKYKKKITKETIKNNCFNNNHVFLSYNNTFINKYNLFNFDLSSFLNIYSKLFDDKFIRLDKNIVDLYDLFMYLLLLIKNEYLPVFDNVQNKFINFRNFSKNDYIIIDNNNPLLIINF